MIYLKAHDKDLRVVVLEMGNIRSLMAGHVVYTPDKSVVVCVTNDPVWLADKIMDTGGDAQKIAALITESSKRPVKPIDRPYHETLVKELGAEPPPETESPQKESPCT